MPNDPDADRIANRIRWPDGPVCPYCGERERMIPESRRGGGRLRYECAACEVHHGYFRLPGMGGSHAGTDSDGTNGEKADRSPHHRPVVPRFPT